MSGDRDPAGAGKPVGGAVRGYIVPGMPHPLLVPERSPAWRSIRDAFLRVRRDIETVDADLLLLYSTQWISVIGHQIQAHPAPEWVHVDPEWHDLGDMPYAFRMDAGFGAAYAEAARARGLHARAVAYHGFPIDTGTVVALALLNPHNRLPASVVSCNMYADRTETLVLGKAAADALRHAGRRAIAISVTNLSNRHFTEPIDPAADRISSLKDDEWNRKLLAILGEGRLEDVSQLARQFAAQANADQKLKAIWWLAALLGQHNGYRGRVFDYQPIWGTGAALVGLVPSATGGASLEFDEEDAESHAGDRSVLAARERPATTAATPRHADAAGAAATTPAGSGATTAAGADAAQTHAEPAAAGIPVPRQAAPTPDADRVCTDAAPAPVGAYPHARRAGDLVYLSGVGPRQAGTNAIPGGPVRDAGGRALAYDAGAQTRAVIENVRTILEAAGSSLERVLDVTVFLIDMERDFEAFNEVYAEHFEGIGATRTTVEVRALPTPIAVEFKVIASLDPEPHA
ncbi:MAG: Rid family hydrolase [Candidatus Krumholzibacteriia bacterium]